MSSSGLRAKELNAAILRLYSQSKGVLIVRLKAREKTVVIEKPHLTLFATGNPEFVYSALSPKALTDGLMGRCLFVATDEAQCLIDEMMAKADDLAEGALKRHDPIAAALMCRFCEKAQKLARTN